MKRLISFTACVLFAFSAYSQSYSSYDDLLRAMKTDQVLQNIYFDLQKQVAQSIDMRNRSDQLTAPIRAEKEAVLKHVADSMGITYVSEYYYTCADTAKLYAFKYQTKLLDDKYRQLEGTATQEINNQYRSFLQDAFIEAAKKYYNNAEIIKGNN